MQSSPDSLVFSKIAGARKRPAGKGGKRLITLTIMAALIAGAFYATPFMSLFRFKSAIVHRDAGKISSHVDFAKLRESLKSEFYNNALADTADTSGDGTKMLSDFLAAGFAEMAIDFFVTPEGIAALLCGKEFPNPATAPSSHEQESTNRLFEQGEKSPEMRAIMDRYREKPSMEEKPSPEAARQDLRRDSVARAIAHDVKYAMHWKNLDTFVVVPKNTKENHGEFQLFFTRKGLSWKFVGVKFPRG
jgi:hypothetical protein